MNAHLRLRLLLCLSILPLTGCANSPPMQAHAGGSIRERNQAYSILHDLMTDESKVGGLMIIKHADAPIPDLIKEIANYSKGVKQQLEALPTAQNHIEFDLPDLPKLEQRSRELQAHDDTKALLSTSGEEFETRLIFTQAQATDYARQLCKALAEAEDDPARKAFLTTSADQFGSFHDRLAKMLKVEREQK